MTGNVFISYRRDDASGSAGRLYDRLVSHFPEETIFFDIDQIALGVDFVAEIQRWVTASDVLLAVIGKSWLAIEDERGQRRIDNPNDFVRLEISTALQLSKTVIPVLVDSASMPIRTELPADLRPITRRNAATIGHESFNADAQRLINALQLLLDELEEKRKAEADEERKRKVEEKRKAEADEKREREAEERRKAEADEKRKREAEERRKAEADEKRKREAEERRKAEADEKRKREAEEKRKVESESENKKKQKGEIEKKRKANLKSLTKMKSRRKEQMKLYQRETQGAVIH